MAELSKEQRETARIAHKDIFDRCQSAINSGFYLEAILMEYAAMEARMKVIMTLFHKPCALCEDISITHDIGLQGKVDCFKYIIENNPSLFEKAKFTRSKAARMGEFCKKRNIRIHGLLEDTDSYNKLMKDNQKIATRGYELLKLLYNETNRLKRIAKNHPELITQANVACFYPDSRGCVKAKQWLDDMCNQ